MATRDTRREENQRMFRGGNEALRDAARNIGFESTPVPFMCECANIDCRGQVEVTPREWERVVARPSNTS
jgi:AraC-like DNA-binding protein